MSIRTRQGWEIPERWTTPEPIYLSRRTIIAVAAAEVGVGLAMVLLVYRNRKSISLDELSEMKG